MNTRQTLPLPLHCYDEAGRVKPPLWMHWCFFWGARSLLLLVAVLLIGPRGEAVPALFYASNSQWILHCSLGLVYLALWLLMGRREWFWQKSFHLNWMKSALIGLFTIDLVAQTYWIAMSIGEFRGLKGAELLISLLCCFCVLRSSHLKLMMVDWRQ